jgi:DNA-binding beta-propeller fold protein YncE
MSSSVRMAALSAISAALSLLPAQSILKKLPTSPERIVSTVPPNGDLNPYGVAFVPEDFREGGPLEPGDILVSNFNGTANVQGTGTTIVRISRTGQFSVFLQGPAGLGLTTALGVLKAGFILVGNLPTTNGNVTTSGSLIVLDRHGALVAILKDASLLDGPWDLTIHDEGHHAQIFVSNVLSGTVTRLDVVTNDGFKVVNTTQIASGYLHRFDSAALVIGPTGLAFDADRDLLYVASTGDNAVFAIPHARQTHKDKGMGQLVYQDNTNLHGPLGLALAPNGHLITANGDAINPGGTQNALVEFTVDGKFVAQFQVDPGPGGGAFGLAFGGDDDNFRFAAVDDDQNTLDIWNIH